MTHAIVVLVQSYVYHLQDTVFEEQEDYENRREVEFDKRRAELIHDGWNPMFPEQHDTKTNRKIYYIKNPRDRTVHRLTCEYPLMGIQRFRHRVILNGEVQIQLWTEVQGTTQIPQVVLGPRFRVIEVPWCTLSSVFEFTLPQIENLEGQQQTNVSPVICHFTIGEKSYGDICYPYPRIDSPKYRLFVEGIDPETDEEGPTKDATMMLMICFLPMLILLIFTSLWFSCKHCFHLCFYNPQDPFKNDIFYTCTRIPQPSSALERIKCNKEDDPYYNLPEFSEYEKCFPIEESGSSRDLRIWYLMSPSTRTVHRLTAEYMIGSIAKIYLDNEPKFCYHQHEPISYDSTWTFQKVGHQNWLSFICDSEEYCLYFEQEFLPTLFNTKRPNYQLYVNNLHEKTKEKLPTQQNLSVFYWIGFWIFFIIILVIFIIYFITILPFIACFKARCCPCRDNCCPEEYERSIVNTKHFDRELIEKKFQVDDTLL